MDKHLHDIDKFFLNAIEPLEEEPGTQVWKNVANALDKNETVQYKKRSDRFKKLSLLLLLLLGIFSVYHFITIGKLTNNKTAGTVSNKVEKNSNTFSHSQEESPAKVLPASKNPSSSTDNLENAEGGKKIQHLNTVGPSKSDPGKAIASLPVLPGNMDNRVVSNQHVGNNGHFKKEKRVAIKVTAPEQASETAADNNVRSISGETTGLDNTVAAVKRQWYGVEKIKTTRASGTFPSVVFQEKNVSAVHYTKQSSATKNGINGAGRFSVGASYSLGFINNNLHDDRHDDHDDRNKIKSRESDIITASAAVFVNYKAGKHLSLETGITMFRSSTSAGQSKIYAEKDDYGNVRYRQNSSSGFCYFVPSFITNPNVGDSLQSSNASTSTHYLEVPLMVRYSIGKNKIIFNPGVGITFSFLTDATSTAIVQDNSSKINSVTTALQGLRKTALALLINPQFQYKVSRRLAITATPYLKYALQPVTTRTVVNTYPVNLGGGLGLLYRF